MTRLLSFVQDRSFSSWFGKPKPTVLRSKNYLVC